MPLPPLSASIETFFDYNEYCAAAVSADPATRDLESLVVAASEKVAKAVGARTAAKRKVNRDTAQRDFTFRGMTTAVDTLECKARAEFEGGETAAGYKRLFARTPSQLGKTTIEARAQVFDAFVAEAESEETPVALVKPVKAMSAAWAGYQSAFKHFTLSQAALAKAREKEVAAKTDNLTALRKLEGKLMDRFPDDLKRVRSYSPPPKPVRKQAEPTPAAPEMQSRAV